MISLTTAMQAALGRAVSQPLCFIRIDKADGTAIARWSTRETITWDAQTWSAIDVMGSGASASAGLVQEASITVRDPALTVHSALLNELSGVLRMRVWIADAAALAAADPLLGFDGIVSGVEGGEDRALKIMARVWDPVIPRRRLWQHAPEYCFAPEGASVSWGTTTVRLVSRDTWR